MARRLAFLFLLVPILAAVSGGPARAEIPYRYSISEGFILAIDDASRRTLTRTSPVAQAILERTAEMIESDRFRIPVAYARTLAWNLGQPIAARTSRDAQLSLFTQARRHSADRAMPATVLFLRLSIKDDVIRLRADAVDLVRGESRARFSSDAVPLALPGGCAAEQICAAEPSVTALDPFIDLLGDGLLDLLGPAPPRGYGEVSPPWLIEPISYRIDFRGLGRDDAAELAEAMVAEFDYYLDHEVVRNQPDRLTMRYDTIAPSWWLAERLVTVAQELDLILKIEPRPFGLRITSSTAE